MYYLYANANAIPKSCVSISISDTISSINTILFFFDVSDVRLLGFRKIKYI